MSSPRGSAVVAACFILSVLGLAGPAAAQTEPGMHTWVDLCEVEDETVLEAARSECALIYKSALLPTHLGYEMLHEPATYIRDGLLGAGEEFCTHSRFYGQPRPVGPYPGRSGVLVAPDLVLTAAHLIPNTPAACLDNYYFVFDWRYEPSDDPACSPPSHLDGIPADKVYECVEIVRHGIEEDGMDYLLVRLDRPVTDRRYVRVRRSGLPDFGDPIAIIQHPDQLPVKVDTAATFEQDLPLPVLRRQVAGGHVFAGSSGSMLFNVEQGYVEAVVSGGGCLDVPTDLVDWCRYYDSVCAPGKLVSGDAIEQYAEHIPAYAELLVAPLDRVVHTARVGGPITNVSTSFTLTAPVGAPSSIHFEIVDPDADGLLPKLWPKLEWTVSLPPGQTTNRLDPGQTATVFVEASDGGALPGVYGRRLVVRDLTNGWESVVRHDFELGVTEFTVSPAEGLVSTGYLPPYPEMRTYTVTNVRLDAVQVRVQATQGFIALNEAENTPLEFTLTPAGAKGSTAQVRVAIGPSAEPFPIGTYSGAVLFENVSQPPELARGDTQRSVALSVTRLDLVSESKPVAVPDGDPAGIHQVVVFESDACVEDLDIGIAFGPADANDPIDPTHLFIELTSPSGKTVVLWDHHDIPIQLRRFDDEAFAPPTGQLLATFDGSNARGKWVLHVVDDVPGGPALLAGWVISIQASSPPCSGK